MTPEIIALDHLRRASTLSLRTAILLRLWSGPAFAKEIAEALGVKRYNLYFHLNELQAAGLVQPFKVGNMKRFEVPPEARERVARLLLQSRELYNIGMPQDIRKSIEIIASGKRARVQVETPEDRMGFINALTTMQVEKDEPEVQGTPSEVLTFKVPRGSSSRNIINQALYELGIEQPMSDLEVDTIILIGRRMERRWG